MFASVGNVIALGYKKKNKQDIFLYNHLELMKEKCSKKIGKECRRMAEELNRRYNG